MQNGLNEQGLRDRLGCCGLNCEECPVFVAATNSDNALREKTAKEWPVLYSDFLGKTLESSEIECRGCHSKSTSFLGCRNCPIKNKAVKRTFAPVQTVVNIETVPC